MIEKIIEVITDWYYILIITSIFIGFVGGYLHNNGSVFLFTLINGGIMLYYEIYLRPLITSYTLYESETIIGYMLSTLSILSIIIYLIVHYNIIIYGGVVE